MDDSCFSLPHSSSKSCVQNEVRQSIRNKYVVQHSHRKHKANLLQKSSNNKQRIVQHWWRWCDDNDDDFQCAFVIGVSENKIVVSHCGWSRAGRKGIRGRQQQQHRQMMEEWAFLRNHTKKASRRPHIPNRATKKIGWENTYIRRRRRAATTKQHTTPNTGNNIRK